MELKLKLHPRNTYPLEGILIKNPFLVSWIKEIQRLNLSPESLRIYPIPGTTPNTIWGCLLLPSHSLTGKQIGKNEWCQKVTPTFFIAERSILQPVLQEAEIQSLFSSSVHVFHPEFGLAELSEELQLEELLQLPSPASCRASSPQDPVFIPKQVKSFSIQPVSHEEIMKNLEENIFPQKEKMEDKPLSLFEKGKLSLYKMLFDRGTEKGEGKSEKLEKTAFMSRLESILGFFNRKGSRWISKIEEDFEDLEERNQKEIDKLINLLKKNPGEALKYAIPLDNEGISRGEVKGSLDLMKRWPDFSLFGNRSAGGSGAMDIGDHYNTLQSQYHSTAQELIKQKEFYQAAFVYLKLLRSPMLAAQALESGNHFQEAATVYLQNTGNKRKAAECYEKGHMIPEAIELYKELNENEKAGDLYVQIGKREEADIYYEKVADDYKVRGQYVKASLVYRHKMNNCLAGQSLLLEGWRNRRDDYNCLNNYFAYIEDIKNLKNEISELYRKEVTDHNRETFLKVLAQEYRKDNELSAYLKDLAYEIVAIQVKQNPAIVSELKTFNPQDKELLKDTMRFKLFSGKKKR